MILTRSTESNDALKVGNFVAADDPTDGEVLLLVATDSVANATVEERWRGIRRVLFATYVSDCAEHCRDHSERNAVELSWSSSKYKIVVNCLRKYRGQTMVRTSTFQDWCLSTSSFANSQVVPSTTKL